MVECDTSFLRKVNWASTIIGPSQIVHEKRHVVCLKNKMGLKRNGPAQLVTNIIWASCVLGPAQFDSEQYIGPGLSGPFLNRFFQR